MSRKYVGKGLASSVFGPTDPLSYSLAISGSNRYESRSRSCITDFNNAYATGQTGITPIALPLGLSITSITFVSGGTASSGLTHMWYSLYDSNLNLLAMTSDNTTTWNAHSTRSINIATVAAGAASSFTTTYEGLHYIGVSVVAGTTMPTLVNFGKIPSSIMSTTPYVGGMCATSYTTPPAFPVTLPAPSGTNIVPYGYVN